MENQITETLMNPPMAVVAGSGAVLVNTFITALPVLINCVMAVYLVILVCHKSYQFYNEIKDRRAKRASSE